MSTEIESNKFAVESLIQCLLDLHHHIAFFFILGSVTSTDSGLGFYDPRLGAQRIHGHPQQIKTQHGKSISGKLINVTGNPNSGTKGNDINYQLSSSASIKEQRKHQQALLQQQRQRKKSSNISSLYY